MFYLDKMDTNESEETKFENVYPESTLRKIKEEFTHLRDKTYLGNLNFKTFHFKVEVA